MGTNSKDLKFRTYLSIYLSQILGGGWEKIWDQEGWQGKRDRCRKRGGDGSQRTMRREPCRCVLRSKSKSQPFTGRRISASLLVSSSSHSSWSVSLPIAFCKYPLTSNCLRILPSREGERCRFQSQTSTFHKFSVARLNSSVSSPGPPATLERTPFPSAATRCCSSNRLRWSAGSVWAL